MSHNKITVAGQQPDSSGNVSVSINDLNGVNVGTPNNNDFLKYVDSSDEWQSSASASITQNEIEHIWIGQGANQNYPESWTSGNDVYFYSSTAPVNTIQNATVSSSDPYSNWYDQFNLPAGTYFIYTRVQADFSSSAGYITYKLREGTTNYAPNGYAVASGNSAESPQLIQSVIEFSSSTTLTVRLTAVSNVSSASTNQGEYGFILIQRVL